MHVPVATYRVQLHKEFGFRQAGAIAAYLEELGVSHFYASPIFEARAGSMHGYDIVDPGRINPELGDEAGLDALVASLRKHGLYWLQDIVPNHMAFDSQNALILDVLEKGRSSKFCKFFDIDWNHLYEGLRGRLLVPFLGKFYAEALEDGDIRLVYTEDGLFITYYSLRLPLKVASYVRVIERNLHALEEVLGPQDPDFIKLVGTVHFFRTLAAAAEGACEDEQVVHAKKMLWALYLSNEAIKKFIDDNIAHFNGMKGEPRSFDDLDALIAEQFFRLSYWKVAAEEINYRRFFTINELISLRVEDEDVFNFTHAFIFKLLNDGVIQALRVDHVDGLYDPAGYLRRLRERSGDAYIVVEKILEPKEELPADWPVEGTTGYDFLNCVNGLFCRRDNEMAFDRLYHDFTGQAFSYDELVAAKKRLITGKHLAGNVDNLAHMMKKVSANDRYGRDITLYGLKRALVEVMANFPVYRTYINTDAVSAADRHFIDEAVERARRNIPDFIHELNFIHQFLLMGRGGSLADEDRRELLDFVMNFQQYTAPLMAKGFEDTVLYIYNRLISLNEVGSSPNRFGTTPDEFHAFNRERAASWPHSMNTTATHDTKRGEDARARINVLSELPDEWAERLKAWEKMNEPAKKLSGRRSMPDKNDEYFLYQTLIGAWPFAEEAGPAFTRRIRQYMVKAVREAKIHTAWVKPDIEYENACSSFVNAILTPSKENRFLKAFLPFQRKIAHYGILNSLSQTLLKTVSVGVPDLYQGSELWDLSLVDPDNRRPVDFQKRAAALRDITKKARRDTGKLIDELLGDADDGRVKLFLMHRALWARKECVGLFREGTWYLDVDGNGRWSIDDVTVELGAEGDTAVVGDFNGDGIDDIGVYRAGTWYLDTDGNRRLDANDKVFELGGPHDKPAVADFNGDGIDDIAVYQEQPAAARQVSR